MRRGHFERHMYQWSSSLPPDSSLGKRKTATFKDIWAPYVSFSCSITTQEQTSWFSSCCILEGDSDAVSMEIRVVTRNHGKWKRYRRTFQQFLLLHCIGAQEQTSWFSSWSWRLRYTRKPGKWKCHFSTRELWSWLTEVVRGVREPREEQRVKGLALLVLNTHYPPGSYEKKSLPLNKILSG